MKSHPKSQITTLTSVVLSRVKVAVNTLAQDGGPDTYPAGILTHVHINVHETFVQYRLVGWNYCDSEGVCVRGAYEMNGQESMLHCFAVDGEMIKHV